MRRALSIRIRCAAALLLLLAATQAQAVVCTWLVDGPGNWDAPGNWSGCSGANGSPANTPGPADDVLITAATPLAEVNLLGARSVARLTLQTGKIVGSGNLTVALQLDWSGGAIEGVSALTDQLILPALATVNLSNNQHTLRARRWVNQAAVNWTAGDLLLAADAELDNLGTITASPTIGFVVRVEGDGSPAARLHNNSSGGTISLAGSGSLAIKANVVFDNGSAVNANVGTLRVESPGGDFGTYTIGASGTLEFAQPLPLIRNLTGSPALAGNGLLRKLGAGALNINGGYTHTGPVRAFDGELNFNTTGPSVNFLDLGLRGPGKLGGNDDFVVDLMTWEGGELSASSAGHSLTIPATKIASMNLNAINNLALLNQRTLINQGSFTVIAGGDVASQWSLANGANIDNQGTFEFRNNNSSSIFQLDCVTVDCATFENRSGATLRFDDSGGIISIQDSLTSLNNAGTIDHSQGCAAIDAPGIDTGTYLLDSGCTFAFFTRPGSERIFQPGLVVTQTGAGFQVNGRLRVNGTGRNFDSLIIDQDGVLYGPAVLILHGQSIWRGTIEGSGVSEIVRIAPGADLDTTPNPLDEPTLRSRRLLIQGNLRIQEAHLRLDAAEIDNQGTLGLFGSPVREARVGCVLPPSCATITNQVSGIIISDGVPAGPINVFESEFSINHSGSLVVVNGQLDLEAALTTTAGSRIGAQSGAILRRTIGNLVLTGGRLLGDGTIESDVVAMPAELSPGDAAVGMLTIDGNLTMDGASSLRFEVDDDIAFDRLSVTGSVALAGTLDVINLFSFTPLGSEQFDFLQYASRSGSPALGSSPFVGFSLDVGPTRVRYSQGGAGGAACVWNASRTNWSDPLGWDNCGTGTGVAPGTPGSADSAAVGNGNLTLDVPSIDVGTLSFTGGTITGGNDLDISTALNWTGGRFEAPSSGPVVRLLSSATATLSGGPKALDQRNLFIAGEVDWTTGLIELANGADLEIDSSGVLNTNPAGAPESIFESGTDGAQLINNGAINKFGPNISGIGDTVDYFGNGSITVNLGRFRVYSDGNFGGAYSALTGELEFSRRPRVFSLSSSFAPGSKFIFGDNSGSSPISIVDSCMAAGSDVVIGDMRLQLNCVLPTSFANLRMERDFASISGPSSVIVTTHFEWSAGTLLGSGPENFELAVGATANFAQIAGPASGRTLWDRSFNNHGTITWTGHNDTTLRGSTVFDNAGDGTIIVNLIGNEIGFIPDWNLITSGSLVNHGLYHVVRADDHYVDVPFINAGTFRVSAGATYLTQAGTDTGTYDLNGPTAAIRVNGPSAIRTIAAGGNMSGVGGFSVGSSAQVQLNGGLNIGTLSVSGGATLAVNSPSTVMVGSLILQSGGTLTGGQQIDVSAGLTWDAGNIAGTGGSPGDIRLLVGSTSQVTTVVTRQLSERTLQVDGALNFNGGQILVPNAATGRIHVGGTGQLIFNASVGPIGIGCVLAPCTRELESEGTIRQLGTEQPDLQLSSPMLIGAGLLEVDGGGLQVSALNQTGGAVQIAAALNATSYTLNGGELRGDGLVIGTVNNLAGTLRPGTSPGTLSIFGNYNQGASGSLVIEVAGPAQGTGYDHLFSNAMVTLGGSLTVVDAGHTPVSPDVLSLVFADASLSGSFASTSVPYAGYSIVYTPNSVELAPNGPTFVVNSLLDPGTGTCDVAECTLREAIDAANALPAADTIGFDIPAVQCLGPGGACVIVPTSPLPPISTAMLIDGYTQGLAIENGQSPDDELGTKAVLKIELDGSLNSAGVGLDVNAPSAMVAIRGLAIHGFGTAITTQGPSDSNYIIGGNFIGLRADGSLPASPQLTGINVQGGNTFIGDGTAANINVISGNQQRGIAITALPALGNAVIRGNLIGTTPAGSAALGNGQQGILAVTTGQILGILIGGNLPDHRNVISSNGQDGIRFECTAISGNCFNGARVYGNWIGPAADGAPLGNVGNGVNLSAMNFGQVDIGGVSPGQGNVIAGNGGNGILATFGSGRAAIRGNEIFANGMLAIDLAGDGRTANDVGDSDLGPNGLLNFPLISNYVLNGPGDGAVIDVLMSTPDAGGNYPALVEFHLALGDEPGVWLGSTSCSAPPTPCSASISFPGGVILAPDDVVLATVTDGFGKSSEASFYSSTATITGDAPDPSTIGVPYTVTVDVLSSEAFAPQGSVDVSDGAGGSCLLSLARISNGLARGSCALTSAAPVGGRTLSASYAPTSAPQLPFTNSSDTEAHTVTGVAKPVVTLISPANGPVAGGTLVNVTGANFAVGATTIHFGATLGIGASCTSTTQCTVTSPAGTGTVNLRVDTVAGSSIDTLADDFVYSGAPTLCTNVTTATEAVGTQPSDIALGDFNVDGHRDIAVVNSVALGSVSVLLGTGTGSFAVAVDHPVGAFPRAIAVGDFNSDGNSDLAVANYGATTVSILLGDGTGDFATATGVLVGTGPHALAVGDFDGDGEADLAVALLDADTVTILRGLGDGSFALLSNYTALRSFSIGLSDFNRDGHTDFVIGDQTLNSASVALGVGNGSFLAANSFIAGSSPVDLTINDFNADGISDIAVVNRGSANVSIFMGVGDGTFAPTTNFAVTAQPSGIDSGDFDGDGDFDLAVSNISADSVELLLGDGGGSFVLADSYIVGLSPSSVVFGDFNDDNRADIAATTEFSNEVAILLNVGCPPSVDSISPNSGGTIGGTSVTLTGTNFVLGGTSVDFGPTPAASVTCSSSTQCVAVSPPGPAGTVSLRASTAAGISSDTPADNFTYTVAAQPTVTTIVSVSPEPSVVGQPYTVSAQVTQGGSPVMVGTITVRQLSDNQSCSFAAKTATSCTLTANSAITTVLQASYSGSAGLAPSNSAIVPHQVNRANTSVSIVSDTPDPSLAGQPIEVTVSLDVIAPGLGTPTGQILITDSSGSCGITLPELSCSFVPKVTGAINLEARYLGDANFNSSTDTETHLVTADGADLAILKRNGLRLLPGGAPSTYILLVSNAGPQAVVNARVTDILPAQLSNASWTCTATGGATCPPSGVGTVDALVSMPAASTVSFALTVTAQRAPEQIVSNRAVVTPPGNAVDPVLSNNESTDIDPIGVFADGFETENE